MGFCQASSSKRGCTAGECLSGKGIFRSLLGSQRAQWPKLWKVAFPFELWLIITWGPAAALAQRGLQGQIKWPRCLVWAGHGPAAAWHTAGGTSLPSRISARACYTISFISLSAWSEREERLSSVVSAPTLGISSLRWAGARRERWVAEGLAGQGCEGRRAPPQARNSTRLWETPLAGQKAV